MDASRIILTPEARAKYQEELVWREGEKQQEIIEALQVARAFGDLSENSEYDAAKDEEAKNASRIAELRAILANAKDADEGDAGIVSVGSIVTLVDGDGVAIEVTLVGTTETDSLENKISNESPLGHAIVGRARARPSSSSPRPASAAPTPSRRSRASSTRQSCTCAP